jgi:hypothetical protein
MQGIRYVTIYKIKDVRLKQENIFLPLHMQA